MSFDAKPVIMRAFQAAKGANDKNAKKGSHGPDYVERCEFRLLLVYLRLYFELWEMFESIDEVPRPEAIRIMQSAAALLLFNPPELARYLPGKLYAYLAARRPILVFGDGGEAATLVRQLDAGVSLEPDDPHALAGAIDRLVAGTLLPPNGPTVDAWLAAHTYERTAARFFALLEALASP